MPDPTVNSREDNTPGWRKGDPLPHALEERISRIEKIKAVHLNFLMAMFRADGGKIFPMDLLAAAALKRSMAHCTAFSSLVRQHNYLVPATLVRMQMDSCLRLSAAFIVDKPHDFANAVLSGQRIDKMKDRGGKQMRDSYLVSVLKKTYPWMPRVYERTSGFIHLSNAHIFSVFGKAEKDRVVQLTVGDSDTDFPEALWLEMSDAFLSATDAVLDYVAGWIKTKESAGERPLERSEETLPESDEPVNQNGVGS